MSRRDINQIINDTFDADKSASKVSIVDADMQIELSHEDGDSVLVKKETTKLKVKDGDVIDLTYFSKLISCNSSINLEIKQDGELLFTYPVAQGQLKDLCFQEVTIKLENALQEVILLLK